MYKIALGVLRGANAGKTILRDPSGEAAPRNYLFDDAFSPAWDESITHSSDPSKVPKWWRMAREIQLRNAEYEAVVTWGEKLSLALLMQPIFHCQIQPRLDKLAGRI